MGDVEKLEGLTRDLWIGKTFCAHAPGAMEPLMSAIKYFRPEFDQKIAQAVGVDVIDAAANQQPVVK